ncbi:MAG TPA: FAD-dependent oxidoreductase [Candidatus Rubrimentiphilum sp.]|nr:FAD-dependent oxidoreductase [Candidatus Rubrimentiphilum sp.]
MKAGIGPGITRRQLLRTASAAGIVSSVPRFALAALREAGTQLTRVLADESRVIRTVVGLRPFRQNGFALSAHRFGRKLLVHNYGHGGGGISLSWGVATLAADLAKGEEARHAAVLGCGVIGLSTARILQERGYSVTIYTKAMPPNTTSNIAGGQWTPTHAFEDNLVTPQFRTTFEKASTVANRRFQLMVGARYGIRWIDNYEVMDKAADEQLISTARRDHIASLYTDIADIDPASTPFRYPFVTRFTTMLIEPNTYLPALISDFYAAGGRIVNKRFDDPAELARLPEPVVFNCTGLGSHKLFNDNNLYPARGQLTILEPQADVNYIVFGFPQILYMFPRSDGIVLGGTFQPHDWSLTPNFQTQREKLALLRQIYR